MCAFTALGSALLDLAIRQHEVVIGDVIFLAEAEHVEAARLVVLMDFALAGWNSPWVGMVRCVMDDDARGHNEIEK